jgi:uncharacterized protein YjbI with pentapeptide repeats
MANEEHVARLRKGVDAWNAWRKEDSDVPLRRTADPDLIGANFIGANLRKANLRKANLTGANRAN